MFFIGWSLKYNKKNKQRQRVKQLYNRINIQCPLFLVYMWELNKYNNTLKKVK